MNAAKIFALALIAAKDKETVNVPVWAGVVSVAIGGGLLFLASKKS